jgi:conjugative transposon TraN protein
MKKLLFYIALFMAPVVYAQDSLRTVYLSQNRTLHFLSPEPIQYVDISNKVLAGDLPLKNVLRLRLKDSLARFTDAVVTIAGEKFIAQYRVLRGHTGTPAEISIDPQDTRPLDISGIGFSQNQLKAMALAVFSEKPKGEVEKVKDFGMTGRLNQVYTAGDYVFLDISYKNDTRLRYDIGDLRFRIDDKKVNKASNVQSVELKPEYVLFTVPAFTKRYRNIFVFRKMSFPGNKVLLVELTEKQPSGRILTLKIAYQDILDADTLPN